MECNVIYDNHGIIHFCLTNILNFTLSYFFKSFVKLHFPHGPVYMHLVYVSCVQGNQMKFDNHWRDQLQWMGLFMVMWQMLKCMPEQLFVCSDKHNHKIILFSSQAFWSTVTDVDKEQCTEQLAKCWPLALSDTQP